MMRLVAALTHQSVVINGLNFPDAKLQFPKLRGGTADSTLKFMLRLLDTVENEPNQENEEAVQEFRQKFSMSNGNDSMQMEVDSLKVHATSTRQSSAASALQQNLD